MLHVYGIKNCNTVKKALTWLKDNNVPFEFHDFKKEGVSENKLKEWETHVDWEALINKKGTTWKKLSQEMQNQVVDSVSANKLLQENTSMIKRPIVEYNKGIILGFNEAEYVTNLK